MQKTLSIIKPDGVKKNIIGQIFTRFENSNLELKAFRKILLSKKQAQNFYLEHKDRPFYNDLIDFMCSGAVVVCVLQGENAINKNRELMGDTNPKEAKKGTIRADFATSIDANVVHGSDSEKSALREIEFFFKDDILVN